VCVCAGLKLLLPLSRVFDHARLACGTSVGVAVTTDDVVSSISITIVIIIIILLFIIIIIIIIITIIIIIIIISLTLL
jgi:hypothetical protein